MMEKKCFGYDEEKHVCTVLSTSGITELRKKYGKFCGTMSCPFYKPHEDDIRLYDKIIERDKG